MLKSEIFTAGARSHGVYTMLCVTHDSGESDNLVYLYDWEKFSRIYINIGK